MSIRPCSACSALLPFLGRCLPSRFLLRCRLCLGLVGQARLKKGFPGAAAVMVALGVPVTAMTTGAALCYSARAETPGLFERSHSVLTPWLRVKNGDALRAVYPPVLCLNLQVLPLR